MVVKYFGGEEIMNAVAGKVSFLLILEENTLSSIQSRFRHIEYFDLEVCEVFIVHFLL